MLEQSVLLRVLTDLDFKPGIDLIASRVNTQFRKYVSFQPDLGAIAIVAFTLNWSELKLYAFPPFSVIAMVLAKIQSDGGEGGSLCVAGLAYPKLICKSISIDEGKCSLFQSLYKSVAYHPDKVHPL